MYILYVYMCMCVCVCVVREWPYVRDQIDASLAPTPQLQGLASSTKLARFHIELRREWKSRKEKRKRLATPILFPLPPPYPLAAQLMDSI